MPDVRRLVGVGGGVLDDHLGAGLGVGTHHLAQRQGGFDHGGGERGEVDPEVDVAGATDGDLAAVGQGVVSQPAHQLGGDLFGWPFQNAGQPEGQRRRVVP